MTRDMLKYKIDMPDITKELEIIQPEPNPARKMPPRTEPDTRPERKDLKPANLYYIFRT